MKSPSNFSSLFNKIKNSFSKSPSNSSSPPPPSSHPPPPIKSNHPSSLNPPPSSLHPPPSSFHPPLSSSHHPPPPPICSFPTSYPPSSSTKPPSSLLPSSQPPSSEPSSSLLPPSCLSRHSLPPSQSESSLLRPERALRLPEDFAESLLDLEMEVIENETPPISSIKSLLGLYVNAVEYYESIQNKRFLIYKNKINELLSRQNIILVLNSSPEEQKKFEAKSNTEFIKPEKISYSFHFTSPPPLPSHRQNEKPRIFDASSTHSSKAEKIKNHDLQVFLLSQSQNSKEKAENMLNNEKSCFKHMDAIIQKEIDSQEKSLLDRIETRKRTVSLFERGDDHIKWRVVGRKEEGGQNGIKEVGEGIKLEGGKEEGQVKLEGGGRVEDGLEKYNKEIEKLKMSLKNKDNSLLIKNVLARKEKEREEILRKKNGIN